MRLSKTQFEALAPYEKHFDSAVNHRWTRFPGGAALDLIHDTLKQVTGLNLPLNKCCSHCILELMTEMGKVFFTDKFEMLIKVGIEIAPEDIQKWSKVGVPLDVMTKTIIKGDNVVEKHVVIKESLTTDPVKVEVKRKRVRKPKTQE